MALPHKQSSIRVHALGEAIVDHDVPIPDIRPGQLLVKTIAVSMNPSDWMVLDWSPNLGTTVGSDYAGVVLRVGEDVKDRFEVGDRVAGFTHCANTTNPSDGAFSDFIAADAKLAVKIPQYLSFEEASPLALGVVTAAQYLYQALELPLPVLPGSGTTPSDEKAPCNVLVYGGGTATGMIAIQLAKLSGATVITTCSPRSNEWVKSLGADAVFNYNDPQAVAQIQEYLRSGPANKGSTLNRIMDCIGNATTAEFCAGCFVPAPEEKCIYAPLLKASLPEAVDSQVLNRFKLAFTCFGYAFRMSGSDFPASDEERAFMVGFFRDYVQPLLDRKLLQLMPVEVRKGTWEDVVEGIKDIRNGGGRGKKLVWRVADP